jgi:hypothetical protein
MATFCAGQESGEALDSGPALNRDHAAPFIRELVNGFRNETHELSIGPCAAAFIAGDPILILEELFPDPIHL